MIFKKKLQKMLEHGLTLQIWNYLNYCLKEKMKQRNWINKSELAEQIMKEFVGFKAKTYSYSKDSNDED